MDRLAMLEHELDTLAGSHPLYPRTWRAELEARRAETPWFDVADIVVQMREERDLIAPGPATIESLIAYEQKFTEAFEPDELIATNTGRLAGTGA
jgi:hypothetical protein